MPEVRETRYRADAGTGQAMNRDPRIPDDVPPDTLMEETWRLHLELEDLKAVLFRELPVMRVILLTIKYRLWLVALLVAALIILILTELA